jgi:hypothetical protein
LDDIFIKEWEFPAIAARELKLSAYPQLLIVQEEKQNTQENLNGNIMNKKRKVNTGNRF